MKGYGVVRFLRPFRGVLWSAAAGMLILALCAGCSSPGAAVETAEASPKRRPASGEPYLVDRFRIGWYDGAKNVGTPGRLAELGFDAVMPYTSGRTIEEVRSFLAAAEAAGIGVHLDITRSYATDTTGERLEEYVRATAGSPAILSWYLSDEPEWRPQIWPRLLESAYARIKALDPGRDVALVFMFPGLSGAYRKAMDRLWIDWYPVRSGGPEFAAFRGGRFADRMKAFGRRADRYGLPLTLVLQGYGKAEDGKPQFGRRLPTAPETLYMFYAALLARPEEVLYWTLYRTRQSWLEGVLVPIVREFREKFPDSLEYSSAGEYRVEGGGSDSVLLGNGRGGRWLLVLNREGKSGTLRITAPAGFGISRGEAGLAPSVTVGIEPYGVLLLKTGGLAD